MRGLLKWFLMLNKRLYKKPTFLVILALIPICAFVLTFVAKEESGFIHIVLVQTNQTDEISGEIIEQLLNEKSIIRFSEADTPEKAVDMVETGVADCAWIFAENMQEKITAYKDAVHIVYREQTVFLRLTHEKLFSVMYEYCAKTRMIEYARTNVKELNHLSNEDLLEYFENVGINEELFVVGENEETVRDTEENYLLFPIRGLLGILIVLCGMAAMMYYMQDERNGTFAWVPETNRVYVALSCLWIAILNVAVVALAALYLAGMATEFWKETVAVIMFAACCTGFCLALKRIFRSLQMYGAVLPLVTVIMIAICPVFFDFRQIQLLQYVFPPTYYVNVVYDDMHFGYMGLYCLVCGGLYWVLGKLNEKRRKLL